MKRRTKQALARILSSIMVVLMIFTSPGMLNLTNVKVSAESNSQEIPPILITEIVPDSTNVGTVDGFEFIEIYNNTDQTLNFKEFQVIYRYPTGPIDDLYWVPAEEDRDVEIAPGEPLVIWVKNNSDAEGSQATIDDFNDNYGVELVEGEDIVVLANSGAMHNQRMREMIIRTNTGEEVVVAEYNKGQWDVKEDHGILYQYPTDGTNNMVKVSGGEHFATPGVVEDWQVPDEPVTVDPATTPTVTDLTASSQPLNHVEVVAAGADDFLLSSMTLFYREVGTAEDYQTLDLEKSSEDGHYHHVVPVQNLIGVDQIEYYFEATNGLNTVTTDVAIIDITAATNEDIPPLLITELVVQSPGEGTGTNVYEFVEVYNNTNQPIDFGDYHIIYRYPTSSPDQIWFEGLKGTIIEPGETLVLWVDNGSNDHITYEQFISNFEGVEGSDYVAPDNIQVVKAPAGGGMANGSERDLIIATNTGEEIVSAGYNKPGSGGNVASNMGLHYHFPIGSTEMMLVRYGTGNPATPGIAEADLIPESLIEINTEAPTVENLSSVDTVNPGETVELIAQAEAEYLVTSMQLFYKHSEQEAFTSVDLQYDSNGLFSHTFTVPLDITEGSFEYYFVASNGFNETVTDVYTVNVGTEIVEIPDVPVLESPRNGETDVPKDAELSVVVTDPSGGQLDVGFYKGKSFHTGQRDVVRVYENAADVEPPAQLVTEGEVELSSAEYALIESLNGEQVVNDSVGQFPYHRFEVTLDDEAVQQEAVDVMWHGSSIEGRKVSLYAWNHDAEEWVLIDDIVAQSDETFSLAGEVPVAGYVQDNVLNILVQDEIPPRDEYDYTFVWLSDTQFYAETFPELFEAQVDWIVENKDELNIEYVFHTGDIVNTWNQRYQWELADEFMGRLETADIPYGVLAGNHDIQLQPEFDYSIYYEYFGADRFEHQPYYGGSFENNRGHYDLISVMGVDYIMVYMGWQPEEDGIAWINDVLSQYPDRVAILNFHQYLDGNGNKTAIANTLYEEVVLPNPNVQIVLGGHHHGSQVVIDEIDDDGDGVIDREVYQILGDFQNATRGGDGFMNVMSVDADNDIIYVNTISVDEDVDYELFEGYTISLDLQPRTKRVATDFLSVNVYSDEEIGVVEGVNSGETATITWSDLDGSETYYWYATATNEAGETSVSDLMYFTTVNTPPEIYAEDIVITAGDSFNPFEGVTAHDAEDGDITDRVRIAEYNVNIMEAGTYSITYEVIDRGGLSATTTITVTVLPQEDTGDDECECEVDDPSDRDDASEDAGRDEGEAEDQDGAEDRDDSDRKEEDENKLPQTATNMYNYLALGLVLIVLAGAMLFIRKRYAK